MISKHLLLVFMDAALAACAGHTGAGQAGGKIARPQVPQSPAGEAFTFKQQAKDLGHDGDDSQAEATRIDALEQALRINKMCQKGYTISSRRVIVQIGEKDEVDYEGRCIP